MSRENVETALRVADAVNRGDVEAVLLEVDPEIEFIPQRAAVEGAYRGHEGMRRWLADTAESYDLYQITNDEIRDVGDHVVNFDTVRLRGKQSGAEITLRTAIVQTFRNGKIVRFEDFGDRRAALEAVGQRE